MGVKQLWNLLGPVGRPVLLETMEGKALAIDSSIWIYQFQATMRDKEGRGLVNAHILGFLRRICKLLYYGIKPVFVFDGGAPALKRSTLNERRKKKSGAADSHIRVAEKLLAAQLRREALKHVSRANEKKAARAAEAAADNDDDEPPSVRIDDNVVYLEDLESNAPPVTPVKAPSHVAAGQNNDGPSLTGSAKKVTPDKAKRNKWQDHDPYKLPDIDFEAAIAKATSSSLPDPRLATEEELQAFIDDMRPEDFNVDSEAFQELPTEVQYEIIGDLRLKSRQTSHKRLQSMLRSTNTPLDFSKAQIQNLQKRNALTQQLLVTTNMVARANLTIPIRVASERNREYVLIKNDDASGGWVLGIRDEGTAAKPITVDVKSDEESPPRKAAQRDANGYKPDADLREFRQTMALAAIGKRQSPVKRHRPKSKSPPRQPRPLFLEDDDEGQVQRDDEIDPLADDTFDPAYSAMIEESIDDAEAEDLRRAIAASVEHVGASTHGNAEAGPSRHPHRRHSPSIPLDQGMLSADPFMEDIHVAERMPSVASSAGDVAPVMNRVTAASLLFGLPTLLMDEEPTKSDGMVGVVSSGRETVESDEDSDMEEVLPTTRTGSSSATHQVAEFSDSDSDELEEVVPTRATAVQKPSPPAAAQLVPVSDDDLEMVSRPASPLRAGLSPTVVSQPAPLSPTMESSRMSPALVDALPMAYTSVVATVDQAREANTFPTAALSPIPSIPSGGTMELAATPSPPLPGSPVHLENMKPQSNHVKPVAAALGDASGDEGLFSGWSRSPSPALPEADIFGAPTHAPATPKSKTPRAPAKDFDAADELDPEAEEGDFVQFMSQVKGKDLDTARQEVDAEILALNKEKKAAMRDSEDVTQQMIGQIKILLRLFGIPYVTAPMEAEAQCAALVEFGLVDGVITDDSDIFLFGGLRVFRNMFNQSKTVECFLLADLTRELGLDRSTLVRLAYLLGSDYTDGLPGIGPVVAMELLKEFPGDDGLLDFRAWWTKVQNGKDTAEDTHSKFRQRFKKKYKDLYLSEEWPNPRVREGYYQPAIDESREGFTWALPDIDGLRKYLQDELGWNANKVDETLLPIVRRVGQRGRANAINKQSNLNSFFDITAGAGTYAPRQKQAYASKRLQKVVADFRKGKATADSENNSGDDEDEDNATKGKQKRAPRTRKAAKPKAKGGPRKKRKVVEEAEEEEDVTGDMEEEELVDDGAVEARAAALSLRPRLRPRPKVKASAAIVRDGGDSDSGDSFKVDTPRKRKI